VALLRAACFVPNLRGQKMSNQGPVITSASEDLSGYDNTGYVRPAGEPVEIIRGDIVGGDRIVNVTNIIQRLSQAEPGDIQKIAASQIELLNSFYTSVLGQANRSFIWALVAAIIGLVFFLLAITFLLVTNSPNLALVSTIGGVLIEVISGINFALYGRTTAQLANFHQRLDQTQHFLLANSICEALQGEVQQKTRSELVMTIATHGLLQPQRTSSEPQADSK
jgi:hypothetical protein